ncbi:DUF1744-domain-containing protein [Ascobolus immersus RN42]|uniref:DNA polymerase epsilon catalytic subunit n=1 Tax=Ascobolus immersus RN42 TaxID=1160509 RepID=A0A3N4IHT4_ASCIM|nr:DUF1744-domain-containing protein [Ascobolus immersus RN42]
MSNGRFRKPFKKGSSVRFKKPTTVAASSLHPDTAHSSSEKFETVALEDEIDEKMGFVRFESGKKKVGWLVNMQPTILKDENASGGMKAAVDYYFIEDGNETTFKASLTYEPYFLIAVKKGVEAEVEEWCRRKFEGMLRGLSRLTKEDLSMPNHLLGYRRTLIKLTFDNVSDLLAVRKTLLPIAEANKKKVNAMDAYMEVAAAQGEEAGIDYFEDAADKKPAMLDAQDAIIDIREYDVPYHVRVSIDKNIRIGKWYEVEAKHGTVSLRCLEDRLTRADPIVLAWDIETTKLPLKFPDPVIDQIMMISYMVDGQGFLITNREIVSQDIDDFEYTPKPEYPGHFMIFNEVDEKAVLERFFDVIKISKPTVMVTYNGDFFDWPFVEARSAANGIDMYREIGFKKNSEDIYTSRYCAHMDAFSWVKRDSYLPQGSQGLKAVTTAKLGYDPDELDPEDMTPFAVNKPQTLAEYSVSDAVATYYLYMKYVHPFIFSLCTIIPLNPDDVLRKGTGTLCEMLLMVQAYEKEILLPNKHKNVEEKFYEGHLLESETYVGGHVESIEAGVFRSDIPTNFAVDTKAIDELLRDLDAALKFSIVVEEKKKLEDVTNYDEVKEQIKAKLLDLKNTPMRNECPSIYHLDVASMYPNIMTTNRLQPDSLIQESDCAACDFNRPGKTCDRRMPWAWRGEYLPAKRDDYNMIRLALQTQKQPFPGRYPNSPPRKWDELSQEEQTALVKKRLQDYSKKIYHKIHESKTIVKEAIICQRENPFYVDTVKDFRDRRYDFKGKQKTWKIKTDELSAAGAPTSEIDEAKKMIILYDSLQLAHKVILNSFYGYVMRKGSRWYSMEMAGVTCLTGAHIIQMARQLVERIGRPLELDTDGIWCMLPGSFPENFAFKLKGGKKLAISYPCVMLNHLVHAKFTNHQYQELVDPKTHRYETHSENSIFFEVDGPYRAMILPTSKEEDKNLKKRYAVFNHDGSLAELKGFELKRRGELKLIKIFQGQIFRFFLDGKTLPECYAAVAKVANRWLDVLNNHGSTLADEELIDLICENRSMSKSLAEYGSQKSTSITTARRLAEFLGEQMVKDKGLNCKYIISARPKNAPVTERAIPVAIFSAEHSLKKDFLRKWLKEEPTDMDPRSIIDWDYYLERLGSVIQKLITIPAALQKVRNPVPRVAHPEWLQRRINIKDDRFKQKKMTDLFQAKKDVPSIEKSVDIEDFGSSQLSRPVIGTATKVIGAKRKTIEEPPAVADPFASLPSEMPDPNVDYIGFLAYQKQKWKIQKAARKRRKQLFGERTDSIGTFFRNKAEEMYTSTWQILQLRETETPGEVKAWVLMGGAIHNVRIQVPRQLFLNVKSEVMPHIEVEGCHAEKAHHTLPNGHVSTHLFRLEMDEQVYISKTKELTTLFCDPSVEGVYEAQIPLATRALLHLGATCTYDLTQKGGLGRGMEVGFDLKHLVRAQSKKPYLQQNSLDYLFVYHVVSGERQIFSIFSSGGDETRVLVLNAGREAQQLPNLEKIYGDQYQKRLGESGGQAWCTAFEYNETVKFSTTYYNTSKKLQKELLTILKGYRDSEKSTVLILQSPQKQYLLEQFPVLTDFPMLNIRSDVADGSLPVLGWQQFVAKRIVSGILTLGSWIDHLLELARYGDIPICNLERDDPQFLIDIAYARRLQSNDVILWWSDGPSPDHGGYEKDDVLGIFEKVEMPLLNNPGAYSSVCVEVEVRNLAINTILTSSLINELEGSDAVMMNPAADGKEEGAILHADKAFASAGVAVLREMVKSWWNEACKGNRMADVMVQHLIRWVTSPTSFLYDRTLHYYVQMMSKKAFLQLLSDFRKVGTNIIHATPSRILLQTSKVDVANAFAFSNYILGTFKTKPLFHFLEMDVKEYWDYLLWFDDINYGGKACSTIAQSQDEEQEFETILFFQTSKFLPERLQEVFKDYTVDFIDLMWKSKRAPVDPDATPRATQIPQNFFKPLTVDSAAAEKTQLLPKEFTKPLKKAIHGLLKHQRQASMHSTAAWDAPPHQPLSTTKMAREIAENPVLHLVKSLTLLFTLPKEINLEARQLRKDLLAILELREFSKQAQFQSPGLSYPATLACTICGNLNEMDLCRNAEVLSTPPPTVWACEACGSSMDLLRLEEEAIADVGRAWLKYIMQDLKCAKCGVLQAQGEMAEFCKCGGEWVGTVSEESVRNKVEVLKGVADRWGWGMLKRELEGLV